MYKIFAIMGIAGSIPDRKNWMKDLNTGFLLEHINKSPVFLEKNNKDAIMVSGD